MNKIIPYGKQYIDKKDISAVVKSLKQDKITTGKNVDLFENKLKNFLRSKYVISCNSGTSALLLSLLSIEIKKDDIIIMPAINFISSYNICKILGAKIFLSDVDRYTGQITPETINECIDKYKLKKIKAVIVMYHGGYPENAEKYSKIKKNLGCFIIEDACHALGSEYMVNNKFYKVGSCKHVDISTFSLHPLKSITTGEGGLVSTNSKKLYEKIKLFRSLGIKRGLKHWKYDIIKYGLNLRLNDIQSALGSSQLDKIKLFINKRKKIADYYNQSFKNIPNLKLIKYQSKNKSSFHLYMISIENFDLKKKDNFFSFMLKKKIMMQYHYIPIYKFKVFKKKTYLTNSEKFYNTTFSLPIYYELTKKKQNLIIKIIKDYLKKTL